jgi:hypothetical protein
MRETRLPDCRPPQHDESVTFASSHPELISGDFTMRPRPYALAGYVPVSTWSRNAIAALVFAAGVLLLHAVFSHQSGPRVQLAEIGDQALSCTEWHHAASAAVAQLAESTRDADLRQVSDAVFRMRRARQNCEEGWFVLACQDYYSVARNLPGFVGTNEESSFTCRRSAG